MFFSEIAKLILDGKIVKNRIKTEQLRKIGAKYLKKTGYKFEK